MAREYFWAGVKQGVVARVASLVLGTLIGAVLVIFGFDPRGWFATWLEAPPEWLDHPAIKIGIVLFGAAIIVATYFYDRWQRSRSLVASRRIPLTEFLTLAAKSGWNTNKLAVPIGENGLYLLLTKLRQAAKDDDIQFHGRRSGETTLPKSLDNSPLTLIAPAHFEDHEISPWGIGEPDNSENRTLSDQHPHQAAGGYRDLHVNEQQAKDWLSGDGKPPEPASFSLRHVRGNATTTEFIAAVSLEITNIGNQDLGHCLVTVEQIRSNEGWRTLHLALRTEGQIQDGRTGRFNLSKGQSKIVPLLFEHNKDTSWAIVGEQGDSQPIQPPGEAVIGIYGGKTNGRALVSFGLIEGRIYPSVDSKPVDFVAHDNEGA